MLQLNHKYHQLSRGNGRERKNEEKWIIHKFSVKQTEQGRDRKCVLGREVEARISQRIFCLCLGEIGALKAKFTQTTFQTVQNMNNNFWIAFISHVVVFSGRGIDFHWFYRLINDNTQSALLHVQTFSNVEFHAICLFSAPIKQAFSNLNTHNMQNRIKPDIIIKAT